VEVPDFIHELFQAGKVKDFVALIRRAQAEYADLDAFLEHAAAFLSPRLYERFYNESPPEALFGLFAGSLARSLFPRDESWRPAVRQAFLAALERKRTPWNLDEIPALSAGDLPERWERFQAAADFSEALGWAKGFLQTSSELRFFRRHSLKFALGDKAFYGRKFVYLSLAWKLLEQVGYEQADRILVSPLHYLCVAPSDRSPCPSLTSPARISSRPRNRSEAVRQGFAQLEEQLLFGQDLQDGVAAMEDLLKSGTGPKIILDVLLLASAQAVCNAEAGAWSLPLGAFHFAYWAREFLADLSAQEGVETLPAAAALLFESSRQSREQESNRDLDEVIRRLCPTTPLEILPKLISLGDPYAAATAAYAAESMGGAKTEELFGLLARQAAKTDPVFGKGYDLLFVWEAAECYRRSGLPWRHRLPASVAFFLARLRKTYDLAVEYGV
jgi:hypothetical protein